MCCRRCLYIWWRFRWGIYSATYQYSFGDQLTTFGAFVLFALPSFWVGTMAIVFLGGGDFYYWFPPGGCSR